MCPFCLATAAWIAAAAVSAGGITAVALKKSATGNAARNIPTNSPSKEDRHGWQHHRTRTSESSFT
jgi:hypothetical protein